MPASKSVTELTQVAARAAAEKFGTEMIAIDLSDQMVLSEVLLIVLVQIFVKSMPLQMRLKKNSV